jgi:hypothetical protein
MDTKLTSGGGLKELLDAINAKPIVPKTVQVDGYYLADTVAALKEAGFKHREDITFQPDSGLRGYYYTHKELGLDAEVSAGNFLGSFTELQISPVLPKGVSRR